MIYVTREFKFDSAHFIEGYKGDCGNTHGHSWRFSVTVARNGLDSMGIAIDFKVMKSLINDLIVSKLDHKFLNEVLPFNPTAENLAVWIFTQLQSELDDEYLGLYLQSVKLWENYPECYVEYNGEEI